MQIAWFKRDLRIEDHAPFLQPSHASPAISFRLRPRFLGLMAARFVIW